MNETFSGETNIQMNPLDSLRDLNFSKEENDDRYYNKNVSEKKTRQKSIINTNNSYDDNEKQDKTNLKFKSSSEIFEDRKDYEIERIDNIILNKLNQKNHDLDFELQEPNNNHELCTNIIDIKNYGSGYSPRFSEETEREFCEKVNINIKTPYEKYISSNFKLLKCENVTTLKIDNEKFSFLTNPKNRDDLYFINLSLEKYKFEVDDINNYSRNLLKFTKIPYHMLKKFVAQLNLPLENLNYEIKKFEFFYNIKFLLKILISMIVIFILCLWLNMNGKNYFHFSKSFNDYLILIIGVIYGIILTYIIYSFINGKKIEYYINKILLKRQEELDPIVYKWNAEYFIYKLDYLAVMPKTFKYIMIIMKPNKKINVENHNI